MTVVVTWGNDAHTIINMTLSSHWQWSEAFDAKEQIKAMLDSVDHKVSILACGDIGNWLPVNFNKNMFELTREIHPNVKRVIIVHQNILFEQLVSLFFRLNGGSPFEFVFVNSLEDAQQYLTEMVAA